MAAPDQIPGQEYEYVDFPRLIFVRELGATWSLAR